jgi:hypothetical protein
MQRLPLIDVDDSTVGRRVEITGGLLAGRWGVVDALPEGETFSASLLIELEGVGPRVWIETAHLSVDVETNAERFACRPLILKQLSGFADSDMRRARAANDNEILISETMRGLVALSYDPSNRSYTLTTQDGGSWKVRGKRAAIRPELINLYSVTEEAA